MGRLKKQSVFIDIEDTVGIFYVFTYYGNYIWSYLLISPIDINIGY